MAQRRPPPPPPHLATTPTQGQATWEVLHPMLAKLEDFLKQAGLDAFSGLPVPHEETHLVDGADPLQTPSDPTTVDAGSTADIGDGPSFAREDHEHAVTTGSAVSLGEANAEGSGVALARASHVHRLDTRVAKNGTTIGTRKRINLIEGAGATITVSDDSAADEVDITISAAPSAGPISTLASVNDYILHRAVHAEAYTFALTTGKI
jgi:hypothetical protein